GEGAASACRAALAASGARFEPAAPGPRQEPGCAVDDPVRLESLALRDGGRAGLPGRPTLDCAAAQVLATYVSDALAPLAKGLFGADLAALETGPGFSCRRRNHAAEGKLSAHARGLAVDVATLRLADGRVIAVGRFSDERDAAFDRAARAAGCGYFNTALGPGADASHATHWHFDLEPRGAGGRSKFCQ
ncbi:extensin family protein, partial [Methylocella sp.]|uniref:extensin family protein n=1 Tax=Methylocella sp. TaxID=1978226 RepID=UPI003783A6D0